MFTNKYRNRAKVNQEFNSSALKDDLHERSWTWNIKDLSRMNILDSRISGMVRLHYFCIILYEQ